MTDKYVSPHPLLEGPLRELLVILMEECAEVQIAASKCLRFGMKYGYPGTLRVNDRDLAHEIGDVLEVVSRIRRLGVLDQEDITAAMQHKSRKLDQFLSGEGQRSSPPSGE